jgi:hypothetical protein
VRWTRRREDSFRTRARISSRDHRAVSALATKGPGGKGAIWLKALSLRSPAGFRNCQQLPPETGPRISRA